VDDRSTIKPNASSNSIANSVAVHSTNTCANSRAHCLAIRRAYSGANCCTQRASNRRTNPRPNCNTNTAADHRSNDKLTVRRPNNITNRCTDARPDCSTNDHCSNDKLTVGRPNNIPNRRTDHKLTDFCVTVGRPNNIPNRRTDHKLADFCVIWSTNDWVYSAFRSTNCWYNRSTLWCACSTPDNVTHSWTNKRTIDSTNRISKRKHNSVTDICSFCTGAYQRTYTVGITACVTCRIAISDAYPSLNSSSHRDSHGDPNTSAFDVTNKCSTNCSTVHNTNRVSQSDAICSPNDVPYGHTLNSTHSNTNDVPHNIQANIVAHCESNRCADGRTNCNTNICTIGSTHNITHSGTVCSSNCIAKRSTHRCAHGTSDLVTDGHSNSGAYRNTNSIHSNADCVSNDATHSTAHDCSDPSAHGNTHIFSHCDTNSHTHRRADSLTECARRSHHNQHNVQLWLQPAQCFWKRSVPRELVQRSRWDISGRQSVVHSRWSC
jgi:hypothetical protein